MHRQRHLPSLTNPSSAGGDGPPEAPNPPIAKKRRGRQPRPSLLTPALHSSIAALAETIGAPSFQPGGFRDFTGWLDNISGSRYRPNWLSLCSVFLRESASVEDRELLQLRKDVVTEIVKSVVKRRPNESSKLVSTNARRQCAVPSSGTTVMKIFESYLRTAGTRQGSSSAQGSATGSGVGRGQIRAAIAASAARAVGAGGNGNRHAQSPYRPTSRNNPGPSIRELLASGEHAPVASSSSGSRASGAMDITSLLSSEPGSEQFHSSRSSQPSHRTSLGSRPPRTTMLPSLSQMDEQIRVRKEKERRGRR